MAAQSIYRLTDNVENLTFATARNHLGYGNDLGNVIVGSKGHDKLFGGDGADTLLGGGNGDFLSGGVGNDKLYGEAGKDNLNGGDGNDLLDGGTGADHMFGGRGDDVYLVDNVKDLAFDLFGGGKDEVRTTVDHTLSANIEMMTIVGVEAVNGTGNPLDNTMNGNDATNVLDGMSGNDTLDGSKGNDGYQRGHHHGFRARRARQDRALDRYLHGFHRSRPHIARCLPRKQQRDPCGTGWTVPDLQHHQRRALL